jgi:DNA repair exonuclease SbcCD ATPase subunit
MNIDVAWTYTTMEEENKSRFLESLSKTKDAERKLEELKTIFKETKAKSNTVISEQSKNLESLRNKVDNLQNQLSHINTENKELKAKLNDLEECESKLNDALERIKVQEGIIAEFTEGETIATS